MPACAFALPLLLVAAPRAPAEPVELFIVWGVLGRWDGSITVENGEFAKIEPFSFEPQYGDEWLGADERQAEWRSGVGQQVDGLHMVVDASDDTVLHLRTVACEKDLRLADFPPDEQADIKLPIDGDVQFLVLGRGDPERGPRLPRRLPLPEPYQPPTAGETVDLPAVRADRAIAIRLTETPPGALSARRVGAKDGRLCIEVFAPDGPLSGEATVLAEGRTVATVPLDGSLWLSVEPRIGTQRILVTFPGNLPLAVNQVLTVPTTLIETRGSRLYVNGEPFLVKGSLPRDLNDEDAAYLKSLGANTVRIRPARLDYLETYDFMGIVMTGRDRMRSCDEYETDEEYLAELTKRTEGYVEYSWAALANPRTLIIQHGNEQAWGSEVWAGRIGKCAFDRLDYMLALRYNLLKPLDPMLPHGYSNNALGYRAPDFLDVYLHNTYLSKDRDWPPLEEFMRFQGCDERPYIHTEFGANVYMPQLHLGGPNLPVLEKIHEWNYWCRWRRYLDAGTCGGTNYCFYDYDYENINENSWDQGFTNFGIMTYDRHPKLACWALWHLWRDFEVTPVGDGKRLRLTNLRDYRATDCRLTLTAGDRREVIRLGDLDPHSDRPVALSEAVGAAFEWRVDYTTHGGLGMVATGVWPDSAEAEAFLERLKPRSTYAFLRELFDAQVVAADGREDVTTLKDLEREDGVIVVCFRKPNGTVYVTAFARRADGPYLEGVSIDLAFSGQVVRVDELTGQPLDVPVETEPLPTGIRLKNLRMPYYPRAYTARSREAVELPVYRIAPK